MRRRQQIIDVPPEPFIATQMAVDARLEIAPCTACINVTPRRKNVQPQPAYGHARRLGKRDRKLIGDEFRRGFNHLESGKRRVVGIALLAAAIKRVLVGHVEPGVLPEAFHQIRVGDERYAIGHGIRMA